MITKEIIEALVPKEYKFLSLGFNCGMVFAIILSLILSVTAMKWILGLFIIVAITTGWSMKNELREFFK